MWGMKLFIGSETFTPRLMPVYRKWISYDVGDKDANEINCNFHLNREDMEVIKTLIIEEFRLITT